MPRGRVQLWLALKLASVQSDAGGGGLGVRKQRPSRIAVVIVAVLTSAGGAPSIAAAVDGVVSHVAGSAGRGLAASRRARVASGGLPRRHRVRRSGQPLRRGALQPSRAAHHARRNHRAVRGHRRAGSVGRRRVGPHHDLQSALRRGGRRGREGRHRRHALPAQIVIALGDSSDAAAGTCGESTFGAQHCAFTPTGSQLPCKERRACTQRPPGSDNLPGDDSSSALLP